MDMITVAQAGSGSNRRARAAPIYRHGDDTGKGLERA